MKSLDQKLANIRANPSGSRDFILADAKDADMAAGLAAPGKDGRTGKIRTLADYREQMRQVVKQGLVDIMLMSASSSELLTIRERLFDHSHITPACRGNDATDVHLPTGGTYAAEPSRPFRTATIEQMQSGKVNPSPAERKLGADLALYSITPNNNLAFDYVTLQAYTEFRIEAEQKGFRHFLEVFDPNACGSACPADLGRFINDLIARTLAGVPSSGRPVFLKIVYHGPKAMEELVSYDPTLVAGILGGSSGTTHDAFHLLEDAKKYGARAALFGRKINNSEDQLTFISYLRAIADGKIGAEEAVKAYHGDLQRLGIKPYRVLKDDLEKTTTATSYAGGSSAAVPAGMPKGTAGEKPADRPKPKVTFGTGGSTGDATRVGRPGGGGPFTRSEPRPAPRRTESRADGSASPVVARTVIPSPARQGGGNGNGNQSEPAKATAPPPAVSGNGYPRLANGAPDFKAMTPAQKVAYNLSKIQTDLQRGKAD